MTGSGFSWGQSSWSLRNTVLSREGNSSQLHSLPPSSSQCPWLRVHPLPEASISSFCPSAPPQSSPIPCISFSPLMKPPELPCYNLFQIILHHGPLPPPAPNPQPPSFLLILTTLSHSPLEQPQPSVSFHPFYTSPLTQPFPLRPEPNAFLTESLPTNSGSAAPWVFSTLLLNCGVGEDS